MKKLFGLILLAGALAGCNQKPAVSGECVIKGIVNDPSLEGKRIFLVPVEGPNVAAYVDSFDIKDGKFEFHKDTVMMAKILMDYRYRYDKQVLLYFYHYLYDQGRTTANRAHAFVAQWEYQDNDL